MADDTFRKRRETNVSPYLERPLRTLTEAERDRQSLQGQIDEVQSKTQEPSSLDSSEIPLRMPRK